MIRHIKTFTLLFVLSQPCLCFAGWFGPNNYEECILKKMKGQDNSLMRIARAACQKEFPEQNKIVNCNLDHLILYANYRDGFLIGTIFNKDQIATITHITVEIVPADETNPFNKFSPRFLAIEVIARPNSMSSEFRVETGLLNPDFHSFRISHASGFH